MFRATRLIRWPVPARRMDLVLGIVFPGAATTRFASPANPLLNFLVFWTADCGVLVFHFLFSCFFYIPGVTPL
jgi:hypothetical protein